MLTPHKEGPGGCARRGPSNPVRCLEGIAMTTVSTLGRLRVLLAAGLHGRRPRGRHRPGSWPITGFDLRVRRCAR